MKRAEEGKEKKKFLSVERCFWPVGTDFTLNLICFSQKSTDNLEITILCLQSYLLFLLSRLKCRYISFTLYFAHQNSSFIQIVKHTKNQDSLLCKKIENSQQSLSKVSTSISRSCTDSQQYFSRGSGIFIHSKSFLKF